MSVIACTPFGAVVIGEHRAAGNLGPAAFALQRGEAFLPGQRVTRALRRGAGCCRAADCPRSVQIVPPFGFVLLDVLTDACEPIR